MALTSSGRTERRSAAADLSLVKPVGRETLHTRVYEELRRLLMAGAFPPGTEISLRSLAQRLGTSEMPVRDAIRHLIAEKALDSLPNRKVIVPILNEAQFEELRLVRTLLEGKAAELACRSIRKPALAKLQSLQNKLRSLQPGDSALYLELNQAFHFTIYGAAGRPRLMAMIETLWLQIGPIITHIPVQKWRQEAADQHQKALDALLAGDGDGARQAIEADLAAGGVRVLSAMAQASARASNDA